ncbi:SRPBCC family protein [Bryobacter aggregatus]|uniref:SRPBCC family protein n=1 Tax=Bryobacter aggregatus TaxID=360054 RepID=UPI0006905D4F|nr:SRPBCC domain-containing protein [Bryobacter aggregatus]
MPELPYSLSRRIVIRATPETVFRFFTDSTRWAKWWGSGSTIDPRPGGKVYIRHGNGIESLGEVLELEEGRRIVFTYGFVSGHPIPPGSSRVTIELTPDVDGTRLELLHELAEAGPRDQHVQGWRFQLSLFSNAVADEAYANAASVVDAWFAAWRIADDSAREAAFRQIAAEEVRFADRYSALDGIADLVAHSGAALRFMPGVALERKGPVSQCQGLVLASWAAVGTDQTKMPSGTNVFLFRPDGKILAVTGLAN